MLNFCRITQKSAFPQAFRVLREKGEKERGMGEEKEKGKRIGEEGSEGGGRKGREGAKEGKERGMGEEKEKGK